MEDTTMANDSQDQKIGQPADKFRRTDGPDTEQDTEGHLRVARGDDNPIGQPADKFRRTDGPDSDDDVEGHFVAQRGDGTVEDGGLGGAKDMRAL